MLFISFQTVAFSMRRKPGIIRIFANGIMVRLGEKLMLTKSVNELLFTGYNDTMLRIARKMKATKLPYDKFAWFYAVSTNRTLQSNNLLNVVSVLASIIISSDNSLS